MGAVCGGSSRKATEQPKKLANEEKGTNGVVHTDASVVTPANNTVNNEKPQIVFVLGGPGSGKGTQCERLVKDYHFKHISVGELLREEGKSESEEGKLIRELQAKGEIVPMQITVRLLMKTFGDNSVKKWLIDGFPRQLDQAIYLENIFREVDFVLNYDAKEETLVQRLLGRAKTSGRSDDNEETIKNRIKVFNEQTRIVLDYYNSLGKVRNIDAEHEVAVVYEATKKALLPNVLMFHGASGFLQVPLAQKVADSLKYRFVCAKTFWKEKKLEVASDAEKVKALFELFRDSADRSFAVVHFPENPEQLKLLIEEHKIEATKFFNFKAPQNEVEVFIEKVAKAAEKTTFKGLLKSFYETEEKVLEIVKGHKSFVEMDTKAAMDALEQQIVNAIAPTVLVAPKGGKEGLKAEWIKKLVAEKQFIWLNASEAAEKHIKRMTDIGKGLEKNKTDVQLWLKMIKDALFKNPLGNKKFIITGYGDDLKSLEEFEKAVCHVKGVLHFDDAAVTAENAPEPLKSYMAKGKGACVTALDWTGVEAWLQADN